MSTQNALNVAAQSIRQAKRALRKQMAAHLATIPPTELVQQSTAVTQHVLNHPAYRDAKSVSIYVSMDQGEVRTEELCKQTLLLGKKLYVPRFAKVTPPTQQVGGSTTEAAQKASFDSDMRMLRVNDWEDYEAMVMNRWGIREPDEHYREAQREDALEESSGGSGLDLILVPGVAFDLYGGRLGHGKGYYDRYIARCQEFAKIRRLPSCKTIALSLSQQILPSPERVPSDERDEPLDATISQSGILSTNGKG
ncbi:5-formyltetrahydrofolate cyclo-ligase [Meira miltonrushii]|uniref:5-formyltetrahydrofolate cyclo-ligase n=1 Tax=Meira miltonrushii TaxID=1280837 RepID=A0A316VE27_9BASI|nr:5-formyltetrahydrofolate cyclo-ligase [Meira miltonrushii]PWN35318.1 5-formyltetrahydrofolate cyclo-ligase [Meira miltonrushii]